MHLRIKKSKFNLFTLRLHMMIQQCTLWFWWFSKKCWKNWYFCKIEKTI